MATPQNPAESRHILVVRNDKLGDFMLAWPALASLKQANPANRISVLVPDYTAPLAHACPWIDEVLLDPGDDAPRAEQRQLLARLCEERFDALLTLFSTPRIGWLGWRAGIPLRVAPATKWVQVFYNQRVTQRRSRSEKPEYRYNQDLAETLLHRLDQSVPDVAPPYWPLAKGTREHQRERLVQETGIDPARRWIFMHAGSGGSAVNLTPSQYAALAVGITRKMKEPPSWLLTAGPGEEATAQQLCNDLGAAGLHAVQVPSRNGLKDFALTLAAADLFIAGSTGPLHIAGTLNCPTVGFYPGKRSATPLRWQTCNADDRRLAFSPPAGKVTATDMSLIDLEAASCRIADWLPTINLWNAS